mmetsp:Transcript_18667/g.32737  ORF Transcript_18667/g.32737 Transcript_18667/m.32737 type:complete len:82 (+) Transcript_18667:692-937(+)
MFRIWRPDPQEALQLLHSDITIQAETGSATCVNAVDDDAVGTATMPERDCDDPLLTSRFSRVAINSAKVAEPGCAKSKFFC